ncbi:hypothetical protein ACE6H2_002046 [Prunus campanulata]
MELYSDNQAMREIVKNTVQHDRTKLVEVDRHYIKEKLLAYVLTHAVSAKVFHDSLDKLGI